MNETIFIGWDPREAAAFAATPGFAIGYQIGKLDIVRLLADARRAARLLGDRHGVRLGCLKPSEAGDGARKRRSRNRRRTYGGRPVDGASNGPAEGGSEG